MFEKPKGSNHEIEQEIDKEIVLLAEELEKTLIDMRQCENNLTRIRQDKEDLERSLMQLIDLSKGLDDMVEVHRYKEDMLDIEKRYQAYFSEIEDTIAAFNSIYQSQTVMFEKLKALRRTLDYGASGTAH